MDIDDQGLTFRKKSEVIKIHSKNMNNAVLTGIFTAIGYGIPQASHPFSMFCFFLTAVTIMGSLIYYCEENKLIKKIDQLPGDPDVLVLFMVNNQFQLTSKMIDTSSKESLGSDLDDLIDFVLKWGDYSKNTEEKYILLRSLEFITVTIEQQKFENINSADQSSESEESDYDDEQETLYALNSENLASISESSIFGTDDTTQNREDGQGDFVIVNGELAPTEQSIE